MKKRLAVLFLSMILSLLTPFPMLADEELPQGNLETAVIRNATKEDLAPLHAEANEYSEVYFKYHTGVLVNVISRFADGWVHVSIGNVEGYMFYKYLAFDRAEDIKMTVPLMIPNTGGDVNSRSVPSIYGEIIGTYPTGTEIPVLGEGFEWNHMCADGQYVFIKKEFLTLIDKTEKYTIGPVQTERKAFDPFILELEYDETATIRNPLKDKLTPLYAEATEKSKVYFQYYTGVRVGVLEKSNNGWVKVAIGNVEGYIKEDCLDYGAASDIKMIVPIVFPNTNGGSLNQRSIPSTDGEMIGDYGDTQRVYLLGESDEWYHVSANGRLGFMLSKYLKPLGKTGEYVIGPYQTIEKAFAE